MQQRQDRDEKLDLLRFIGSLLVFIPLVLSYSREAWHFVATQDYKYPPRLYYLSYALAISCILWLAADRIVAVF